jgi:hypothetical protein
VTSAISAHAGANDAHALSSFTIGTLAEARIDGAITRDTEVPGLAGPTVTSAISAHAGANDAHALSSFTIGTLAEARIDALVARDSEVTGSVNSAIAAHSGANDAHALSSFTIGTLAEARIDGAIARDSEVLGLVSTTVSDAVTAHAGANDAHALSSFTTGTLVEARIDGVIARDSEVTTNVNSAITVHAATDNAHALSSFTIGTLAEARIDDAIARDTEVTWANLPDIPPGFADGIDDVGSIAETDPQVGALSDNRVPRWSATALVDGQLYDNGIFVGIGTATQTPAPAALLEVAGTVRVASLVAGYGRVVMPNQTVPAASEPTTLTAQCPPGTNVLSGGYEFDTLLPLVTVLGSWPNTGNSWSVKFDNASGTDAAANIFAVCAAIQ